MLGGAGYRLDCISRYPARASATVIARALESHVARDVEPGEAGDALVRHNRTWQNLDDHSSLGR